jgi:hypothetical protein
MNFCAFSIVFTLLTKSESVSPERVSNPRPSYSLHFSHNMDLKETTIGLFGIDAMESLLKLRTLVILAS